MTPTLDYLTKELCILRSIPLGITHMDMDDGSASFVATNEAKRSVYQ